MADKKLGEIKQWKNKELKKMKITQYIYFVFPSQSPSKTDHNTQHPELQIFITHIAKTPHTFILCHFLSTLKLQQ